MICNIRYLCGCSDILERKKVFKYCMWGMNTYCKEVEVNHTGQVSPVCEVVYYSTP